MGISRSAVRLACAALCMHAAGTFSLPSRSELPEASGLLRWRDAEQVVGYRNIASIFPTRAVARGGHIRSLPLSAVEIDPKFHWHGKTGSVADYMRMNRTAGLLVLKDGKIVLERYRLGHGPNDPWISFSVAKSVTSMLLGAAIKDGAIQSVDDPITKYIPELRGSAYDGVTIEQALTMRSGVGWNENYADPQSDVGRLASSMSRNSGASLVNAMKALPRRHAPGSHWHYSTGESNLIGVVVARAVHMPLADYLSAKIWKPFGMQQDATWLTDGGLEEGGCCLNVTLRDYARIGLFAMMNGRFDGREVLPADWNARSTRAYSKTPYPGLYYGYQWWVSPPSAFAAIGIMGQLILIDPKERVVIVEASAWPEAEDTSAESRQSVMDQAILKALADPKTTAKPDNGRHPKPASAQKI